MLSEEAVLKHMKEELEQALNNGDVQKQREHVRAVRSMCDLFLQSEQPVKIQTPKQTASQSGPSAAEWAAMTGEWPPQQVPKKAFEDDDDESNGKSLFDF
ncbi:YwdI family protein [Terribacillus sp. 179-K 1B1 HS]|uniref:YwdI family protein n=1 Tax=Terribacillus sp. 179-K 1B1 HS TaxID=3142388 RepID=UPI00399F3F00